MAGNHFLLSILLLLNLNLPLTASKSKTISLELIHRDSIEYPSNQTNLNFHDKLQRYINISKARVTYLTSKTTYNTTHGADLLRPQVVPDGFLYLVQVQIGNPSRLFYLILDTGSELTWIQCQPCQYCFPQNSSIYDPSSSTTYRKVPCTVPICDPKDGLVCRNEECFYNIRYGGGHTTKGILSFETFQFFGDETFTINDVPFGCSYENRGFDYTSGLRAGLMGLDKGAMSFTTHISTIIGNRFSYCFGNMMLGTKSNLKFGDDIGFIGGAVQTIPFVDNPNYPDAFEVNLIDISINGKPMNFAQEIFNGGVIIDSGASHTFLTKDVYWKLHQRFEEYFLNLGLEIKFDCPNDQLCFKLPDNFTAYPSMTYHFQGADFHVQPKYVFFVDPEEKYFVLMILPFDGINIIGAWNQQDTRFIFDLGSNSLSFVPENCAME